MKIHFSWTISANNIMQIESKIMIASTKNIDCCHTIWVQRNEYDLIDPALKRIAEILPYDPDPCLHEPWTITPKWDIEPRGDVIIGIDADVMVWNQKEVIRVATQCLKHDKICGTIGYGPPIEKWEWQQLFNCYNMNENYEYQYTNVEETCPYYINNGVVMMPKKTLPVFREYYKKWLFELNRWYHDCYYLCQIANTFAIKESQLAVVSMPKVFNYTEIDNFELSELDDTIFLHYNTTRDQIKDYGIDNIENNEIRNRILSLLKIKLI